MGIAQLEANITNENQQPDSSLHYDYRTTTPPSWSSTTVPNIFSFHEGCPCNIINDPSSHFYCVQRRWWVSLKRQKVCVLVWRQIFQRMTAHRYDRSSVGTIRNVNFPLCSTFWAPVSTAQSLRARAWRKELTSFTKSPRNSLRTKILKTRREAWS